MYLLRFRIFYFGIVSIDFIILCPYRIIGINRKVFFLSPVFVILSKAKDLHLYDSEMRKDIFLD
mgnify:CR=1 FL=1